MTDNTQPEALRLAAELDETPDFAVDPNMVDDLAAELRRQHARIAELEAQLESIGAGGVSGPLMDRAADHFRDVTKMMGRWYVLNKDGMATLCADKADAEQEAIDAQAAWPGVGPHRAVQLVEAGASLPLPGAQEAVAWAMFADNGNIRLWSKKPIPHPDAIPLYAAPQPALSAGWVSVDERLPQPNVEVLCAGRGWGNSFVTACYYDDERREWYPINTHWTDATGCAQYPTHWMKLPESPYGKN